ncbi:Cytochrome P450 78A5 [Hibiscus syriacus]|uniref:Cytochrome P450 78A5 n=1 Tax=Hibiscus syriacus TaxID=106335 RepID=A0A6A2X890_HIBSY|nr:cytochrome P450 78A9-like [Hibiscus syriacus]KAE8663395.1 Cytochrome P450 78A5 [Hibiscus syriacus]
METNSDCFWLLFIASKCETFSCHSSILLLLFLCMGWLAMALCFWFYPGGPAWGKYHWLHKRAATNHSNIIPGPRGFPVIGSMSIMLGLAHHKISAAAKCFGAKRLMAFSLGNTRVIVTCNPDVAKEILNSSVFADRPVKESACSLMFNRAIGFAPYGVYWRTLRRIAATHLFSPKQIGLTESQRSEIAAQMVSLIACNGEEFSVKDILKKASLNNMMCLVFGSNYQLSSSNGERDELSRLVEEGYDLLGKLNWSDHLPWLAGLDLQKIRFRCTRLVPKVNKFVNRIIQQHKLRTQRRNHDFVDVLLSLTGTDRLSDNDMVAVLWEMIFRGTDTVAVLIEWILARMVLHPEIQSKLQAELDEVVGKSRALTESDIQSMVYLQAVVKEALRLHPPGPLLSWARLAITDTTIEGYQVPAGTTAMVNMWSITRDPEIWVNPLEFMPERFVPKDGCANVEFSVLGSDLRMAPFGSGRRTCPGKTLSLATVNFWVGSLLHECKWIQSDADPVDLTERLRLSCEMAKPLKVKVQPRRTS